jgi:hypothetical protein
LSILIDAALVELAEERLHRGHERLHRRAEIAEERHKAFARLLQDRRQRVREIVERARALLLQRLRDGVVHLLGGDRRLRERRFGHAHGRGEVLRLKAHVREQFVALAAAGLDRLEELDGALAALGELLEEVFRRRAALISHERGRSGHGVDRVLEALAGETSGEKGLGPALDLR